MFKTLMGVAIIWAFCMGCHNREVNTYATPNVDSIRRIILAINAEQQQLYRTFSSKQDRAKQYKSFCHDSLITITGYGNQLTNAVDASNDLVDGYKDTIHDITVRVYDNTAILTGKAKMFELVGTDTLFEDIWISKVFMNFDGQWRMVLRSSGPLGVNYRKEKPLPLKSLLPFEGVYGPAGADADTFRVVGNQLCQFGRYNSKIEYYAFDDSTFFTKDDPTVIVFRKNDAGKVTHFDWQLADGQTIGIPRIAE